MRRTCRRNRSPISRTALSPTLSSETTVVEQNEEMLWGECTSSGVAHRVGRSLRERRGPPATVDNAERLDMATYPQCRLGRASALN